MKYPILVLFIFIFTGCSSTQYDSIVAVEPPHRTGKIVYAKGSLSDNAILHFEWKDESTTSSAYDLAIWTAICIRKSTPLEPGLPSVYTRGKTVFEINAIQGNSHSPNIALDPGMYLWSVRKTGTTQWAKVHRKGYSTSLLGTDIEMSNSTFFIFEVVKNN